MVCAMPKNRMAQTHCESYVCVNALAHVVADKVEAAYRRGDMFERRRELMAPWAAACEPEGAPGNIVPLRGVRG